MLAVGRGAFGCVLQARTTKGGQFVAIKLILPEKDLFQDKELRQLRREAASLELFSSHKCDHAVQLAGVESVHIDSEICWFVMEFLDGKNMETVVKTAGGDQDHGPISDMECIKAARHVLAALKLMHAEGMVHRDIKPANIVRCDGGAAAARKRSSNTVTGVSKMESIRAQDMNVATSRVQSKSMKRLASLGGSTRQLNSRSIGGSDSNIENIAEGETKTFKGSSSVVKNHVYKLLDFGTALGIDETLASEAMMTLASNRAMGAGTPPYMSPEMFKVNFRKH